MPVISAACNVTVPANQRDAFLEETTRTFSSLLGKGEQWIMVRLNDEEAMLFGGTGEPCCYAEIKSIGLPRDATRDLSAALSNLIEAHLGVPKNRVYIEFADAERSMFGFDGTTFG